MSVTLSNGQSEEANVTIVEMHGEVVPPPLSEVVPEQEQHQSVQQEQVLAPEAKVEQEVQPRIEIQVIFENFLNICNLAFSKLSKNRINI